jgi:hypothetical protein
MRGERLLLRLGEYLVGRACRGLPPDARAERYREWVAELPAILHDPQVRAAPWRAVRMLGYAADTLRGTVMTPGSVKGRIARLAPRLDTLFLAVGLVSVAFNVASVVRSPGDVPDYLRLVWALLFVTHILCRRVRSTGRMTVLLGLSAPLALVAVFFGNAAQAPGDWVNYFLAAVLLLPILGGLLLTWWLRRLQARTGGRHAAPSDPWSLTLWPR